MKLDMIEIIFQNWDIQLIHSVLEYFTAVIYDIHGQEMNTVAVNILQQQILSTLNIQ